MGIKLTPVQDPGELIIRVVLQGELLRGFREFMRYKKLDYTTAGYRTALKMLVTIALKQEKALPGTYEWYSE